MALKHEATCNVWWGRAEFAEPDLTRTCTCKAGLVTPEQRAADLDRHRHAFTAWMTTRKDWSKPLVESKSAERARNIHLVEATDVTPGRVPLCTRHKEVWRKEEMHIVDEDGKPLGELVMYWPHVAPCGPGWLNPLRGAMGVEPDARLDP